MEVPFNRPTIPEYGSLSRQFETFYNTGLITNGPAVRRLEAAVVEMFQVTHAVALSSCTSSLILTLKGLGLNGKVALPSFTFFASAHALVWNGLEPVFVDVEADTWCICPDSLRQALDQHDDIEAILPVHVFGNPCDVAALEDIARAREIALVYDAAHAIGASVRGKSIGVFGDAEAFSLSPTKLVVAGEGGIVTTDDVNLAELLRAGRDYGNSGDYDPAFIGLNARMSEFHATLGLESLKMLNENVHRRNRIAAKYTEGLSTLPGLGFQVVKEGNRSSFKDFTVLIDEASFGVDRDALSWYLGTRGVDSRKYYYPPVHKTAAYWDKWGSKYDEVLPVTNRLSRQVLSLPIWSHMEVWRIDLVIACIHEAFEKAEAVQSAYMRLDA
ncbi:MAG: DegT/DnrJ/EryC1/StrS family aminotransferase [Candidatus Geothermincolia bacterium]